MTGPVQIMASRMTVHLFEKQEAEKLWQLKLCEYAETRYMEERSKVTLSGSVGVCSAQHLGIEQEMLLEHPDKAGFKNGQRGRILMEKSCRQDDLVGLSEKFGDLSVREVPETFEGTVNLAEPEKGQQTEMMTNLLKQSSDRSKTSTQNWQQIAPFERQAGEKLQLMKAMEHAELHHEENKANRNNVRDSEDQNLDRLGFEFVVGHTVEKSTGKAGLENDSCSVHTTEHELSQSAEVQDINNVELVVDETKTSDSTTGRTLSKVTCKIDKTNIIDEESSSQQRFVSTCGSEIHSLSCESASVEKIEVAAQTENVDGGPTKSEHAETQTISPTMQTVATNFPEEPISHSDSETQTLQIFTECCKCGQFSTPESVRLSLDLKREQGQRLALEKLVSIVEQESRDLRQQLLLERTSTCTVQNELIDMKAELTNARKVSSEYKMRVEELEQSLQGARQMVFKMEEQIENTNYFKSGMDYLLEAKLATSKSAEAQKKLEGVQTELLRSQQEVNHLLDKLAEMNREKTDMISSNVHHELLKISDQRAKDAEMRSQQLEYEVRQLKNQLQASPKKTVSFAKHVTKPSSPSTTVQNVAKKSPTTGLSQTKESSFQYKIFSTDSVLKSMALSREKGKEKIEVPGTFQLPEVSSLKSSGNVSADPAEFKEAPLMVSAASDSDSDWSSSGAEDDNKREVQFSPPAKKPKPMSRKSITPERKPIIDQSGRRPPIAPKPSLPPKPVSTTPIKMKLKSVEEKPISFDDQIKAPSLATKRRLSGPKGRARPSKFRRKNVTIET